jgi:hypothetical protein
MSADEQVLATICLFPVDIALVSTTVDRFTGLRKPWASHERVASIVFSLKVVYYSTTNLPKKCRLTISFVRGGRTLLSFNHTVQLLLVRGMGRGVDAWNTSSRGIEI